MSALRRHVAARTPPVEPAQGKDDPFDLVVVRKIVCRHDGGQIGARTTLLHVILNKVDGDLYRGKTKALVDY